MNEHDRISDLSRQLITIQLLESILSNQHHGAPKPGDTREYQKKLFGKADEETHRLRLEIAHLIKHRDLRTGYENSIKP